jgi:ABC-type Mn2+/Zn2+ transport system ATPase subunit
LLALQAFLLSVHFNRSFFHLPEAMALIDPGNQNRFLKLLLQLRERGIGILMNTHDPSMVFYIAEK